MRLAGQPHSALLHALFVVLKEYIVLTSNNTICYTLLTEEKAYGVAQAYAVHGLSDQADVSRKITMEESEEVPCQFHAVCVLFWPN